MSEGQKVVLTANAEGEGPVTVHIGNAWFKAHSAAVRQVPPENPFDLSPPHRIFQYEYEIVLRLRPTESNARCTIYYDDYPIALDPEKALLS